MSNILSCKIPTSEREGLKKSLQIFVGTVESCNAFISIYDLEKANKNDTPDLLRAMLLFACAGLDSVVKQLTKDALQTVITLDDGARAYLSQYVERKLNKQPRDFGYIARAITAANTVEYIAETMIGEITSSSLQSYEELSKVGATFNIPTKDIIKDDRKAREAFQVRNLISHEMDVDFSQTSGHQRSRDFSEIKSLTEVIISIAACFIEQVDQKLSYVDKTI